MKKHLTERQIIEYQFKLLSDEQMAQITEHLKTCIDCQKQSDRLAQKFSSLDLLRDEIKVSEELVSKTIKQKTAAETVIFAPRKWYAYRWWFSAAAAVLIVAAFGIISQLDKMPPAPTETTSPYANGKDKPVSLGVSEEKEYAWEKRGSIGGEVADNRRLTKADEDITVAADRYTTDKTAGKAKIGLEKPEMDSTSGSRAVLSYAAAARQEDREVSEKPPFAPASAIELVTLPTREKVQITIYNSADLTLVRERRNITLKKGWNWLQFMWAETLIDPTSLYLEPLEQTDKVENTQLVFPPLLRQVGRWLLKSQVEGQVPFEVTYFTSGLSWRAFYEGTLSLDEKKMNLACYVRVENGSGEDYENAQTRLIVGNVHLLDQIAQLASRQWPYGTPIPYVRRGDVGGYLGWEETNKPVVLDDNQLAVLGDISGGRGGDGGGGFGLGQLKPKEIIKEGLSEYFLYTIEGTETIPDKWGKRLQSFDINDINVTGLYKYDEERWGKQTVRFLSFANDDKHNLGQTPLPNGNIRIYGTADADGHLSYVGSSDAKYIPVNEEVELNLGSDPLVTIEPTLMDFKTENHRFDKNKNICGWDEIQTWQMKITNTRLLPVDIEITRRLVPANWSLTLDAKDISFEKYDLWHARFTAAIQPRTKKIFNYTVTLYHGTRQEEINK